jgi:hypothetical protein
VVVPSIFDGLIFQQNFDEADLRFHGIFSCTVTKWSTRYDQAQKQRLGWNDECLCFLEFYDPPAHGDHSGWHESGLDAAMAAVGKGSLRLYRHITELEKGEGIK